MTGAGSYEIRSYQSQCLDSPFYSPSMNKALAIFISSNKKIQLMLCSK